MAPEKPTCSSCPHFVRPIGMNVPLDAKGTCQYDPPAAVPGGMNQNGLVVMAIYPPVSHDQGCHKHPMFDPWVNEVYRPQQAPYRTIPRPIGGNSSGETTPVPRKSSLFIGGSNYPDEPE